jgi:UTP:GlnB (protein PII) uridylyltransferase
VLQKASEFSDRSLARVGKIIEEYFTQHNLDKANFCIVIIGSLGRFEALESSDIDLIPICIDDSESF